MNTGTESGNTQKEDSTGTGFRVFGLSAPLLRALETAGYAKPTPIQEQVIPLVLDHLDIMARAQTGSGKTASFVLPVLELWSKTRLVNPEAKPKIKTLVLTPTRELTIQVAGIFADLGRFLEIKPNVVSVIGGESIGDQLFAIQQGCDIIVATPGRFLDVLDKKQMNLSHLEFFILDEADKMMDLGFAAELELVLASLPETRQNLMFSATYPQKMLDIASRISRNPAKVSIENDEPTVQNITQRAIMVNRENRGPLLRYLLNTQGWEIVLVFMANKRAADNIAAKFSKHGFSAKAFHGDLLQEERTKTLKEFKAGKIRVLFATDIAARGLDIEDVTSVINFDLPRSPVDYIHRIGRTGRAGKSGMAISFIASEDADHFRLIEKRCKIQLEREQIAGFEPSVESLEKSKTREKGKPPVKGLRKSKKDKAREKTRENSE